MKKCKCGNTIKTAHKNCRRCRYKAEKERDPIKFTWDTLRRNAKRRKKPFDLTLDEFREFCVEVPYMDNKGISRTSWHIDRIDETKGYTRDNIRPLENHLNVKKYKSWVDRDENGNIFKTVTTGKPFIEPQGDSYDYIPF